MKSRRLLVPIDLENPNKKIRGYLYPDIDNHKENRFIEIKSNKTWKVGMIVLKGGGVEVNDIFKEIVDSGKKIPSVDNLLTCLNDYLIQINKFKIGDIIGIEFFKDRFELIKFEKSKIIKKSKLP